MALKLDLRRHTSAITNSQLSATSHGYASRTGSGQDRHLSVNVSSPAVVLYMIIKL